MLLNWRAEVDEPLDSREALPQLEYIAYEMCRRGVQQLRRDELIELFEAVRNDYPNIRPVAQRSPEAFLTLLEARTGLIVEVGERRHHGHMQPVYEFRHLTFQEYLAGLALVQGHFPGHNSDSYLAERIAPLAGQVVKSKGEYGGVELAVTENWREALRLCIACCNDSDVDKALLAILTPLEGEQSEKIQRPRAILALLCLADEPNVSYDVAMQVISAYINILVVEDYDSIRKTIAYKAAKELAVSDWQQSLIEPLIAELMRIDGEPRSGLGSFIGNILEPQLSAEDLVSKQWMEQQVSYLQQSEAKAIEAALTIIQVAFSGKVQMVVGLMDALLAMLDKSKASAHAAAWALLELSEGHKGNQVWQPEATELNKLIEYLTRSMADGEALEFILWTIENAPTQQAVLPCTKLLKHPYHRVRQAALMALAKINEEETDVRLLFWLDPQEPITQTYIDRASQALDIPEAAVITRLKRLAQKYDLRLAPGI